VVWDVVFNVLFDAEVPEVADDGVAELVELSAAEVPAVVEVAVLVPDFVVAAATCVVDPDWSRTAMTPPRAKAAETLSTAAALRARAARGLRLPRGGARRAANTAPRSLRSFGGSAVSRLSSIGGSSCSGAGDQPTDGE
jgi:hypothetical protein